MFELLAAGKMDVSQRVKRRGAAFFIFLTWASCFINVMPAAAQPGVVSSVPSYNASRYKESWQCLLLQLSSTFYNVVKENGVGLDSGLLYTSRSLGLSRLPLIAEGMNDAGLAARSKWFDQRDPQAATRSLSQLTGKKQLEQLVLLGAYYAFENNNFQLYLDSSEHYLYLAIKQSTTLHEPLLGRQAKSMLGKVYVQAGEFEKGNAVFKNLISECQQAGDKLTEAKALAYLGLYTAYTPATTAERIAWLQKAANLYRELGNKEAEINVLTNLGYLYVAGFQLEKARENFTAALDLEEAIGFPYKQYNSDALAMVTIFEGKFGEPLRHALETVKAAETTRDSIGWPYFYARLGLLFRLEGSREVESLQWMQKTMDRFVTGNGDPSLYLNLVNMIPALVNIEGPAKTLAYVESISGKVPPSSALDSILHHYAYSGCYMRLGRNSEAENELIKAATIEERSNLLRGATVRSLLNVQFAFIFFNQGRYALSREYLYRFLGEPYHSGGGALVTELQAYETLIKIDSILNDPASGVVHYKIYSRILDSTFRVSKIRQAEELQVKYLTEEKENQIVGLNRQAKLEQSNLKQAMLVKNVTIVGIVLAVIIAVLLYKQNTLKQKNNNVITHKNDLLQHLLAEKEWLLKEIHHRVKNNFQTVMGLLGTQSGYLKNEIAISAIKDSRRRIHAMSLIHQRLYQTENLSAINMPDYIHELVDYLRDSYNIGNQVRFTLQIEPIELDLSHCIPLGLILNEAITNSFKYAFANKSDGTIFISLSRGAENKIKLSMRDNGSGLPTGFDILKQHSMGMNLMRGLSAEIGATFYAINNKGTQIDIDFSYEADARETDHTKFAINHSI